MKLYNTFSRSIEDVSELIGVKKQVSMYTCGPTVYGDLQIGNWITFIRWDTLARVLVDAGYATNWYMNITDVGHLVSDADDGDDKLEVGARREGKSAWDIADKYTKQFLKELDSLGFTIDRDHLIRATDHIPEQIELVRTLESKGYTYTIDDGVYFDTSKWTKYGELARLDMDGLRTGARVALNSQKKNGTDFALWKFSPKDRKRDMEWESPWGAGFPGWHLECSAMAMRYLGNTVDIHGGGIDHIPVHHTNEIAQSEAASGDKFAKIWLHSNFLTINGAKASKSLGNSYTLQNLIDRGFSPLDLRMLTLQIHYRSESNFTFDNLIGARQRRQSINALADKRWQPQDSKDVKSIEIDAVDACLQSIREALQNDLNTPQALAHLSHLINQSDGKSIGTDVLPKFNEFVKALDNLFGLELDERPNLTQDLLDLIAQRQVARDQGDWATSDKIRSKLMESGITLVDNQNTTFWERMEPKPTID
jgi:cysteinyl-tRNA synthetase